MAFAKLQSRILPAADAVQAAKLHSEMLPEQQAIMLGAGRPGSGTCWTSHRQNCHRMRNGGWPRRYGLVAAPDAGPRSTCALRKGNDGDMCEQSLAAHPYHSFRCKYGGARARPHRAVQCTLRSLSGGQGAMQTLSTMSLCSTTGCKTKRHPRWSAPS